MIKENTLTVKTISTNIFRHINNYIIEKHGSKEKNVIINGFRSSFKNQMVHDIRRNSFLKRKENDICLYFSNLFSYLEILPKTHSPWQLEREEKCFDNTWENRHSSDFQLQWKSNF